jgi:tRNA threonylcarbamoyladenosine biosynthesis protein TsaB
MICLALDTSTTTLTVAVLQNTTLLAEISDRAERNHSIRLVPTIEAALKQAGIKKNQLNGIAVGQGPGSYTGVRIAATVAKTYAWALGIPLVGVSSLQALALTAAWTDESQAKWFVPAMDARRGQVYTGKYEKIQVENGQVSMKLVESDGNRLAVPWFQVVQQAQPVRIVGETDAYMQALVETNSSGQYTEMRAYAIGLLGQEKFARGEQDDVHAFVPNYTQLAEAEVNWLKNQQS